MDDGARPPWWHDRALVALAVAFAALALAVATGACDGLDRDVMAALGGDYPAALTTLARVVTFFGGGIGTAAIGVATAAWLVRRGEPRAALHVAATLTLAAIVVVLLKLGMDRPRPDVFTWLTSPDGASFPSGHSASSALALPLVASLIAARTRAHAGLTALVVVLVTAIGVSRCYLGVHWPSDVVAGWVLGLGLWRLALAVAPPPAGNVTAARPGP